MSISPISHVALIVNMVQNNLLKRRIRGDLIETLKKMEFLIMVDNFSTFFLKLEIYCQKRF